MTAVPSNVFADNPFTDIDQSYAKNAILSLHAKGILHGVGNNEFKPADKLTREQFAKVIFYGTNLTHATEETVDFSDNMNNSQWYYDYIRGVKSNGIMLGYGNGAFGVGDTLTREQAVVTLVRAFGLESEVDTAAVSTFADAHLVSSWAAGYVALAQEYGLILGTGNNTFAPQMEMTREMVANMLHRAMEAQENAEAPAEDEETTEAGDEETVEEETTEEESDEADVEEPSDDASDEDTLV